MLLTLQYNFTAQLLQLWVKEALYIPEAIQSSLICPEIILWVSCPTTTISSFASVIFSQCNILEKNPAQIAFYNIIITFTEALSDENCIASTPHPNDIQTV